MVRGTIPIVFETLPDPIPYRNSDRVKPITHHGTDIALCDPIAPVLGKFGVCCALSQVLNAIKLGILTAASDDIAPLIGRHPRLDYEQRAQVHSSDGKIAGKPLTSEVAIAR